MTLLVLKICLWILLVFSLILTDSILFVFLIIFGELCQIIQQLLEHLIQKMDNFKQCLEVLKATETVEKSIEKHLLSTTVVTVFGLLGLIYFSIPFYFYGYYKHFGIILLYVGGASFSLNLCIVTYVFNAQSQRIADKYHLLHKAILSSSKLHGMNSCEKELCLLMLQSFKGFSACGYFHLGHSTITTIIGHLLTYLVVLIQFKQSEETQ